MPSHRLPVTARRTASVLAGITAAAAVTALVSAFLPGTQMGVAGAALTMFSYLVPAGPSLVSAFVLAVLASALRHRRRIGLLALLGYQVLALLAAALEFAVFEGSRIRWLTDSGAAIAIAIVLLTVASACPVRSAPGAARRALSTGAGGFVVACLAGWLLTEIFPGTLPDEPRRLLWSVNRVTGNLVELPLLHGRSGPAWLSVLLGLSGIAVVAATVTVFFRWTEARQLPDTARAALGEFGAAVPHGANSILISPAGDAALCYRVLAGTSIVQGDPAGARESWPDLLQRWLAEADWRGWTPGAAAMSEAGMRACIELGLKARRTGPDRYLCYERATDLPALALMRRSITRGASR